MKYFQFLIHAFIFVGSFITILNAQLSGTYTIGNGGNYPNPATASLDLSLQGVSGPVIFNIISGEYEEHFVIDSIPGVSSINTITFQSQEGVADSVTIGYNATAHDSNYVVKIRNADHLIFRELTFESLNTFYGHAIVLEGKVTDIRIVNNKMIGNTFNQYPDNAHSLIFTANQQVDGIRIAFNTLQNCGGASIYLLGGNINIFGTRIEGNIFQNVNNSVYLHTNYAPVITGNRINGYNGSAFYLVYCGGPTAISTNRVIMSEGTGLYMNGCFADAGSRGKVVNNFFQIGGPGSWSADAINVDANLGGCRYYDFYHNTVIEDGLFAHALFRLHGYYINAANNIFASMGSSPAFTVGDSNTVNLMDYNNLYTQSWQFARWHGYEPVHFDSLRKLTHRHDHSISVYPHLITPGEPYTRNPWLNNRGMPLPEITTDIDGNPRDPDHPDPGCVEFTPDPGTTTPLSGIYLLGPGGDYNTLNQALQDLMFKGISGPVSLDLMPGIYTEQVKILSIPGASPENTITIQSQTRNPVDVTVNYSPGGSSDNYVFYLRGADHLRFQNLTLHSDTTVSGRSIIATSGATDDIALSGNILRSTYPSGYGQPINFDYTFCTRWLVENNRFSQGLLRFQGSNSARGIHLIENQFTNSAVNMDGISDILIHGNRFYNQEGAMNIGGGEGYHIITNNHIDVASGTALWLHSRLPASHPGLVANNFIVCGRNSWIASGILIAYAENYQIFYNNIHLRYSDPVFNASTAFSIDGNSSNIQILNNVFANSGGGYVYYIHNNGSPWSISVSDHNDVYTTGPSVARWPGNIYVTDLDSLRRISGKDLNSVSVNPGFLSPTDLHVTAAALDSTALPVAEVTDDYDRQPRHSLFPDIGADEFSATNTPPVIRNLPASVEFSTDTSFTLHIWEYVEDPETPDSLLRYAFNVADPVLQMNFTPHTGNLLLWVDSLTFQGPVQLRITVTDDNWASTSDSLDVIITLPTRIAADWQANIPRQFEMHQNYPNPFNPTTTILFGLPVAGQVRIVLFNVLGQEMTVLLDQVKPAGYHQVQLDGRDLGNGIYFYRMQAGDFTLTRKLILLK